MRMNSTHHTAVVSTTSSFSFWDSSWGNNLHQFPFTSYLKKILFGKKWSNLKVLLVFWHPTFEQQREKKVQIAYSDHGLPKKICCKLFSNLPHLSTGYKYILLRESRVNSTLRSPTCNSRFSLLALRTTRLAAKQKGSQSSEVKKKKHNSTELKLTEPSSRIIPIFVVQPFLFNQRFPRQWLVSESSCLVPLDPTLFLLERRFFGLGKEKQTTKNTAKKQKRLQPIWKICSSNWIIFPGTGKNRKYLKAPPSCCFFQDIWLKFIQFVGKMLVKTLELTVYLQKKTWQL